MNINDCAKSLINYFAPEERNIPDTLTYPGRNAAVITAMNSALQELFGQGKPWVRSDERGVVLRAPTPVTISVTNGSTAGTITGWASWMTGCSIVIEGAAVDNQIRNDSATVRLKYPYSGTTGTRNATVYHDSVEVDADVYEVRQPVTLGGIRLNPIPNAGSRLGISHSEDFHYSDTTFLAAATVAATASTPTSYAVDSWSPDDKTAPRLRLRLFPAPADQQFLAFSATLKPPTVTTLQSTDALPIPFEKVESIFLPLAVSALRQCPFWRGIAGEESVASAHQEALLALRDDNPNKNPGVRFFSKF